MKISCTIIPLAMLATTSMASPAEGREKRAADNCLRAVRGTPSVGLPFCSSFLSISKVTSTSYVAAPTVTVVVSVTSTVQEEATTTTGTATITAATPNFKNKRKTDPTAVIYSMCSSNSVRITSACSQFLSGVPTSTTTIRSTTTPTLLLTASTTITQTSTISTGALTTVTPLPILANGGFDDATNPLRGWSASVQNCINCGLTFGIVQSPFVSSPNAFYTHVATNEGYVIISQNLNLVIGQRYQFGFSYRIGSASNSAAFEMYISGIDAKLTDATTEWKTFVSGPVTAQSTNPLMQIVLYEMYAAGPVDLYLDSVTATLVS